MRLGQGYVVRVVSDFKAQLDGTALDLLEGDLVQAGQSDSLMKDHRYSRINECFRGSLVTFVIFVIFQALSPPLMWSGSKGDDADDA